MANNVNYHVLVNIMVGVLFKKIIQLHYVVVMNHVFMVIIVKIYHHVHLNHVIWVELVYETELDLYVNVQQIVSEVNVKKMIHVKLNHVLGMIFNINKNRFVLFLVCRNSTCYRINDYNYKCVCDQVHTGKNCQSI
jgi:hypothetical protein